MTAVVHDTDPLREIDDGRRQAWNAYSDRLRDLAGEEYDQAESESWDELQRELRRLDRRAKTLIRNAA
jgi:cell division septum initiation protein DivIVA